MHTNRSTDEAASEALRRELRAALPYASPQAIEAAVGTSSTASTSADARLAAELRLAVPNATDEAVQRVVENTVAPRAWAARPVSEAGRTTRYPNGWTEENQQAYIELVRRGSGLADARAPLPRVSAERTGSPRLPAPSSSHQQTRAMR